MSSCKHSLTGCIITVTITIPEFSRATAPASTYTPAPRVLPTPRATRSKVLRQRDRWDSSELQSNTFSLNNCFPKPRSLFSAMVALSGRGGGNGTLGEAVAGKWGERSHAP